MAEADLRPIGRGQVEGARTGRGKIEEPVELAGLGSRPKGDDPWPPGPRGSSGKLQSGQVIQRQPNEISRRREIV